MNLKQTSVEDLSIFYLKNSKSMELIKEKVSRLSKMTRLDTTAITLPDIGNTKKTKDKAIVKTTPKSLYGQIQDAYDSLKSEITSPNGNSTLSYLKSHHSKLIEHSEALEGYIKYRNEPFVSTFSLQSKLPLPSRLVIPDRNLQIFVIGQNDDGQLGLMREDYLATTKFRKPSNGDNMNSVTTGSMHSVLVDNQGDLYTFGFEDCIGDRKGRDDQICKLPFPSKVLQVCCGEYFTAILDVTGTAWYFGGFRNREGKRLYYHKSPQMIDSINHTVVKIVSGESHLILLCENMTCYVFGVAEFGQGLFPLSTAIPVKLYLKEPVLDVYASGFSTFFMTPSGLYGSGLNGYGELGIGHYKQSFHPQAVLFPTDTVIIDVAGGLHHTLFLDAEGQVWATGKNFDGQLGLTKDFQTVSTPEKVEIKLARYPIRKIAAGTSSHHSYVIDSEGSLFCAGQNEYGQLGLAEETVILFQKVDLKKRKVIQISGGCQFSILALTDRL